MDYNRLMQIKEEKDDDDDYMKIAFDFDVKVENEIIRDWYFKILLHGNTNTTHDKFIEISTYVCKLCHDFFYDYHDLLKHNLTHLQVPLIKRNVYKCEHCPDFYIKKDDLAQHIQENHQLIDKRISKRRHLCKICNKLFTYTAFKGHMKEVHSQSEVQCETCMKMFKCERYLARHMMYIHNGVRKNWHYKCKEETVCPKCPAVLDCKSALTTHLRNCHSKEKFTCHICQSTLKCKSYLLAHLKRVHHNDGFIYQCNVCDKEFKSQRYVNIHMKNSHKKRKP